MGARAVQLAWAAVVLFIAGVVLIIISVLRGYTQGGIFFIIPFFYGTDVFAVAGVLCIIFALLCWFYGILSVFTEWDQQKVVKKGKEYGGIVLIGPLPVIFGSSKTVVKWLAIGAAIVVATLVVLMFLIAFML